MSTHFKTPRAGVAAGSVLAITLVAAGFGTPAFADDTIPADETVAVEETVIDNGSEDIEESYAPIGEELAQAEPVVDYAPAPVAEPIDAAPAPAPAPVEAAPAPAPVVDAAPAPAPAPAPDAEEDVDAAAIVGVVAAGTSGLAYPGAVVSYTVSVTNTSDIEATNVSAQVSSAGAALSSVAGAANTFANGVATVNFGTVAPGQTVSATVQGTVPASAAEGLQIFITAAGTLTFPTGPVAVPGTVATVSIVGAAPVVVPDPEVPVVVTPQPETPVVVVPQPEVIVPELPATDPVVDVLVPAAPVPAPTAPAAPVVPPVEGELAATGADENRTMGILAVAGALLLSGFAATRVRRRSTAN
jgi:hypothetical protein